MDRFDELMSRCYAPSMMEMANCPTPYFLAAKQAIEASSDIRKGLDQVFGRCDIKDYVTSGQLMEKTPGHITFTLEGHVPSMFEKMTCQSTVENAIWSCRRPDYPQVKNVYINGRHTTVEWMDGTKTTVAAETGIEVDEYAGLCAAFCKKIYGTREIKKILKSDKVHRQKAKIKKNKEGENNG